MRIVAVSDLHGNLPVIPECDLLIIAGDICPDFVARAPQRAWFVDKFIPWLEAQPAKTTYATWGNHDWLPRPSAAYSHLIKIDELVLHPMPDGVLKLWFTPWSNQFGHWAWMMEPEHLVLKYEKIPAGVDIIVSHQPPFGYGDMPDQRYFIGEWPKHVGSDELLAAIARVQPDIVICGHIHGGHGVYKYGRTTIYSCSLVDEGYRPVNPLTIFDI